MTIASVEVEQIKRQVCQEIDFWADKLTDLHQLDLVMKRDKGVSWRVYSRPLHEPREKRHG